MSKPDKKLPERDPTKTPNSPRKKGEGMPPAGGASMEPVDSERPAATPQPPETSAR